MTAATATKQSIELELRIVRAIPDEINDEKRSLEVASTRDDILRAMRLRSERCRRLAASTTDAAIAEQLRIMADEVDRDIFRLKAAAKAD